VALSLGVGYLQVDCAAPFVLSRGGNAITVAARLFDAMQAFAGELTFAKGPAAAGRALAAVARRRPAPLTFGMVFPFSNHNFDLRYWLASAGLHPDRDVRLVAIPPPLMVETLRAGLVDGFCVGEPWNSLAVTQGLGCIVATQSQLFPRAVEKVLVVRTAFASAPERMAKLLRALSAAAAWADNPRNHSRLAECLARPEYLGAPAEPIEALLRGRLQLGGGREAHDPDLIFFHRYAATFRTLPTRSGPTRRWCVGGRWRPARKVRRGPRTHFDRISTNAACPRRPRFHCGHRRSIGSNSARVTSVRISTNSMCRRRSRTPLPPEVSPANAVSEAQ